MDSISMCQVRQAKSEIRSYLKDRPEYGGIGISFDPNAGYQLKVNLLDTLPKNISLPRKVHGVTVVTELVGHVNAASKG